MQGNLSILGTTVACAFLLVLLIRYPVLRHYTLQILLMLIVTAVRLAFVFIASMVLAVVMAVGAPTPRSKSPFDLF